MAWQLLLSSSAACALLATRWSEGCKSPLELLGAEPRSAVLELIAPRVLFCCCDAHVRAKAVIWEGLCREVCSTERGSAQEASHRADLGCCCTNSPGTAQPRLCLCPRSSTVCSQRSFAFSFSNSSALFPPLQFPHSLAL